MIKKHKIKVLAYLRNWFAPKLQYKIKNKKCIYTYSTRYQMKYESHLEIAPLTNGVKNIYVKSYWTGETQDNIPELKLIKNEGFVKGRIEKIGSEFGYHKHEISLNNHRNKAQGPFKIGICYPKLNDINKKSYSHLSSTITVETEKLEMKVVLPKKYHPDNIRQIVFLHASDDFHWICEENIIPMFKNNKWIICWPIDNPLYGSRYVISWDFNDSRH